MNQLQRRRWLLSPITSWQARRLAKKTGIGQDEAWRKLRVVTHPDEVPWSGKPGA